MAFEFPPVCSSDAGTECEHHSEHMQFLTSSCFWLQPRQKSTNVKSAVLTDFFFSKKEVDCSMLHANGRFSSVIACVNIY